MAKKLMSPPAEEEEEEPPFEEGETVSVEDAAWGGMVPVVGTIMECHYGSSSLGLGMGDDWFAVLVKSVGLCPEGGVLVDAAFLGVESADVEEQVNQAISQNRIHLCATSPCVLAGVENYVHVTRIRLWKKNTFDTTYLNKVGKRRVTEAIKKDKADEERAEFPEAPGRRRGENPRSRERGRGRGATLAPKRKSSKAKEPGRSQVSQSTAISVDSGEGELDGEELTEEEKIGAGLMDRASLKELLQDAKQRMLGGPPKRGKGLGEGALVGGRKPRTSSSVREEMRLSAGAELDPRRTTPLALTMGEVPRDDTMRSSKKRKTSGGTTSLLLAQAERQEEIRRSKNKGGKKEKRLGKKLLHLLGGKKKKKKKSKKGKKVIKKEPGDPSSDGSSGGSTSSSESSEDPSKESDSELSFEPPLRRKALGGRGWNNRRGNWNQEEKGGKGDKGKGKGKKGGKKGKNQWGNQQEWNSWKENQWKEGAKEEAPKK